MRLSLGSSLPDEVSVSSGSFVNIIGAKSPWRSRLEAFQV
ncbi:hypothetical protein IFVP177_C150013 [Vibrio parahaemolyticus]|nr:hypothetical protein VPUCM_0021 [Vibrio parahaemolyticus UCM-V493]ANZ08613.1 hypothetical protein VpaChn25_0012 [Vibrio parahaemolyticus]